MSHSGSIHHGGTEDTEKKMPSARFISSSRLRGLTLRELPRWREDAKECQDLPVFSSPCPPCLRGELIVFEKKEAIARIWTTARVAIIGSVPAGIKDGD
jgi:hypothetical protein